MPWMVQNESLLIEQEEHGPGPKPPDPWHVKAMKLPVPPAGRALFVNVRMIQDVIRIRV